MNQKRNQGRLVDISPCQMVATGDVIEFVAEIPIAIVEIAMQQELGQCYQHDQQHAVREPVFSSASGGRRLNGSAVHALSITHSKAARFRYSVVK